MHRPAQRITRILACAAAVPVILVASGCSSGSGGDDDADGGKTPSGSSSASGAAPAKPTFGKLPQPCSTLSKKTLDDLAPEAKSGTTGKSDDTSLRGSCSWNSLDNNGVHGSQFRWLNVSLARFEPDASRGSADQLAGQYYGKQVAAAKATEGATNAHTQPVTGTGDEASAVSYDLKKKEGRFKQQTVVVRTHNVVVTVDYDGAGLAGEKTPDAGDLMKDAQQAAREAVAAVAEANPSSGGSSPSASHSSSSHGGSANHSDTSSSSSSSSKKKSSTHKTSH
ncbi:DUF3558 family protein [Streptomyces odontomachi]|uniref:DUF3558 family protein n=1 Tax=Streptomyces odontomachi TaxID=2944940 RepID=UPI00210A18CA|nr:DUF3558 domain-containing protein [Streptomyces sp. ODS25]